jgi:hypothetical protein
MKTHTANTHTRTAAPYAIRQTPDRGCGCTSWRQARRLVQHSPTHRKQQYLSLNSFRATRHTPNVQRKGRRDDGSGCGWAFLGKRLLSELISSLRTLSVHMNQRSLKASRRVRTTLYRTWYAWNEGGISWTACITSLDTPLMECIPCLGQGGDASRVTLSPTLRPHQRTLRAVPAHVGVGFRNASNVSFRNVLLKRNSWSRNKYSATINIQTVPSVLASLVLVAVQPRTTKSLTGGTQNTWRLKLPDGSYILGTKRGGFYGF